MLILAFTPVALILLLMVVLRWPAARAGAAGYLSALAIAAGFFGAGPRLLAFAHARALLLSVDVLMIIWAAFLLYRVADQAGAIRVLGEALPHLTADRGMQGLLIGWAFASFLQGVGGFGVPVAVIAPLLVGLGFSPLSAVVVPSVGHAWSVTFGSLGSSFQALRAASGLPTEVLAPPAAAFLSLAGLVTGGMVAHAAAGWAAVRRLLLPTLILGVVMASAHYLAATSGVWNLAAFLGGIAGLAAGVPLARRYAGDRREAALLSHRPVLVALSGYAALVALTLGIQLIRPVREALSVGVIEIAFPRMETALGHVTPSGTSRAIPVLRHAGAILAYASILAYFMYRRAGWYAPGASRRILTGTIRRVMASSVGIVSMVAMAVIMDQAGMTDAMARGLAARVGAAYPLLAPWIGALGAFMTGSNTNSNVVFTGLQMRTAELLGYAAALILAAQTTGGALGSVIAPTKIVVGASTAGMEGREGIILRKTVGYTAVLVLLTAALTWAVV